MLFGTFGLEWKFDVAAGDGLVDIRSCRAILISMGCELVMIAYFPKLQQALRVGISHRAIHLGGGHLERSSRRERQWAHGELWRRLLVAHVQCPLHLSEND